MTRLKCYNNSFHFANIVLILLFTRTFLVNFFSLTKNTTYIIYWISGKKSGG